MLAITLCLPYWPLILSARLLVRLVAGGGGGGGLGFGNRLVTKGLGLGYGC